jgi:hypothetical protein
MSIPTVVCTVCNQSVTKRSTLSLSAFGLGDGRACRTHENVVMGMRLKEEQDARARLMNEAEESLKFMGVVSAVQIMFSFFGWPEAVIYARLRLNAHEIRLVKAKIDQMGGPLMSANEMSETAASAAYLLKMRNK